MTQKWNSLNFLGGVICWISTVLWWTSSTFHWSKALSEAILFFSFFGYWKFEKISPRNKEKLVKFTNLQIKKIPISLLKNDEISPPKKHGNELYKGHKQDFPCNLSTKKTSYSQGFVVGPLVIEYTIILSSSSSIPSWFEGFVYLGHWGLIFLSP